MSATPDPDAAAPTGAKSPSPPSGQLTITETTTSDLISTLYDQVSHYKTKGSEYRSRIRASKRLHQRLKEALIGTKERVVFLEGEVKDKDEQLELTEGQLEELRGEFTDLQIDLRDVRTKLKVRESMDNGGTSGGTGTAGEREVEETVRKRLEVEYEKKQADLKEKVMRFVRTELTGLRSQFGYLRGDIRRMVLLGDMFSDLEVRNKQKQEGGEDDSSTGTNFDGDCVVVAEEDLARVVSVICEEEREKMGHLNPMKGDEAGDGECQSSLLVEVEREKVRDEYEKRLADLTGEKEQLEMSLLRELAQKGVKIAEQSAAMAESTEKLGSLETKVKLLSEETAALRQSEEMLKKQLDEAQRPSLEPASQGGQDSSVDVELLRSELAEALEKLRSGESLRSELDLSRADADRLRSQLKLTKDELTESRSAPPDVVAVPPITPGNDGEEEDTGAGGSGWSRVAHLAVGSALGSLATAGVLRWVWNRRNQ